LEFLSPIQEISESFKSLPFSPRTINDLINKGFLDSLIAINTSLCQNEHQQYTLAQFCNQMQQTWPSSNCTAFLNSTIFSITTTAIFTLIWYDQFQLDVAYIFGTSEFPNIFGTTASVNFVANVSFTIPFIAEFANDDENGSGGVRLFFGHDIDFLIESGFQFSGELNAYLGPLKLTLANANLILGSPLLVQVIYNNNDNSESRHYTNGILPFTSQTQFIINGEAKFSSEVLVFGEPICWLDIQVPHIEMYLNGHSPPNITTQHCGDGFINAIKDKLKDNPTLKFFSNPGLFLNQLQQGFLSFDSKLFGRNGAIRDLVLPLVDNAIADLVKYAAIEKIIGPETSRALIGALTDMINNILFNHKFIVDQKKIEELILAGVTEVLCRVLKPTTCPPIPTIGSSYYDWPIVYDKVLINKPITELNFALGEHGLVELDLNCTLILYLEYHFSFTIRYSKTHGIQIVFPEEPDSIFNGDARLDFSSSFCRMEGELGFLAAELQFNEGTSKKKKKQYNSI
jgi:hypothetical protein